MSIWCALLLTANFLTAEVNAYSENTALYLFSEQKEESVEDLLQQESMKPHIDYYFELLITKHRPDLLSEWLEVERDREAIYKKIKAFSNEEYDTVHKKISNEWYDNHAKMHNQLLVAVKERNDEKIKLSLGHLCSLKKTWNEEMKNIIKEMS
ncbi:hypothetical protein MM221_18435 [Salipaludibacillus sp. LMS25]|jgi:hypothetical protein|uniref:hypothetical protein n=1 Tax=Salipaludibacillus sp. LMS25 TaxID=2924031 RepID=UPI0020D02E69|nr:hypothetical protein [Salipaludibacillus sp. LMS25]UTR14512.1 hypothetical protein MM221_18435 [Salipaludibacillus sp. LMS25]